ncbi:MAG: hypothetical protein J2P17_00500, partial [Mycobacterium sp.]|nr:hypothetical protein [Mycobacterium sp.]
MLTTAGVVSVNAPRVGGERGDPGKLGASAVSSASLLAYCRQSPQVSDVLPQPLICTAVDRRFRSRPRAVP